MAEVIAVGASVIAIVQISDRIIGFCKFYIETARDASSDLRATLLELSMLKTIFENLNFLTEYRNGVSSTASTLCGKDGPIEGCRRSITELEKLFPRDCIQNGSKRKKIKSTFAALAWPLKETKAKKLLDEITRYKTTIILALTTDSIRDIKDIKTKALELHEMLTDSQRQDIYRWLQYTDPSPLHHRAQKQYEPGTANWVLRCPEWTEWLDAKQRCLWIHGIPGAGKTVLISYLIEQIKQHCDQSQKGKVAYVYYYCYFGHNQDESVPFLRWLVNQLCRQAESIPNSVYNMYKHGGEPSLVELLKALAEILDMFDLVYVVVDAIDESDPREDILKVFRDVVTDSRFEKVQLLASSREYIDIERVMKQVSVSVSMDSAFVKEDIRLYVRSNVQSNPKFKRWPQELLDEVEDAVAEGARGMFRWAVCQIDALQRLIPSRDIVRRALANLPKTLDETYDRIFCLIPEEERAFVHHALQWIHFHNELHKEGIPCAVLLQAVAKSLSCLNSSQGELFCDIDTLRELCGCLINVTLENLKTGNLVDDEWVANNALRVSFAHYTVREYIDSVRISEASAAYFVAYPKNFKHNCMEIVLLEALHIQQDDLWALQTDSNDSMDVVTEVEENFNRYCVVAAFMSLRKWPSETCQAESLYTLAFDLLDPSKPNYQLLCSAAVHIENSSKDFIRADWAQEGHFWGLIWDQLPSDSDTVHLLNLILLSFSLYSTSRDDLGLAQKFLEGKDTKGFLQSPLYFESWSWTPYSDDMARCHFEGSIIEVMAQYTDTDTEALELLLDAGQGLFDPSRILFLRIGVHHHNWCKEYCLVERLLESGANPNTAEYQFTPLQIAVASWDLEGVAILLEASADPNASGNSYGKVWQDDTFMARYNHLRAASPLHICRNFNCIIMDENMGNEREKNVKMIEAALLEYGAVELQENMSK